MKQTEKVTEPRPGSRSRCGGRNRPPWIVQSGVLWPTPGCASWAVAVATRLNCCQNCCQPTSGSATFGHFDRGIRSFRIRNPGAESGSRTRTRLPSAVFETAGALPVPEPYRAYCCQCSCQNLQWSGIATASSGSRPPPPPDMVPPEGLEPPTRGLGNRRTLVRSGSRPFAAYTKRPFQTLISYAAVRRSSRR